jgi:poly-gamma-glutamate synthesis protein (capsule biosynthesis protein)
MNVGDILVHSTQLTAQSNSTTKEYNFTNNFQFVAPYITKADYAVANLETTLAGNSWREYSGYPAFNTPDSLAVALKGAGFDMLLTSNNHINDSREKGFLRTGELLREMNFDVIGTRTEESQKKYMVKDIKGIKVGFLNYGYESIRQNGKKSLNGVPLADSIAPLVDTFDYDNKQAFYDEVEGSLAAMKNEGAEFFIAYLHWGNEYKIKQNGHQEEIAQYLCELGVDAIIGGHPHVLQPADVIKSEDTGKETFCVYSMGNFISNQRIEFMDIKTGHTEDGVMVNLNIRKYNDGRVSLASVEYIPTWVNCFRENGKRVYEIVPLPVAYNKPEDFRLNKLTTGVANAKNSFERTKSIFEKNTIQINDSYVFGLPW